MAAGSLLPHRLLILAAIGLFLMNAIAGRVWCGYLCPQTVWTDLFFAVERLVEGDRREHMQRDARKWTAQTWARKGVKHVVWLMNAWWTAAPGCFISPMRRRW